MVKSFLRTMSDPGVGDVIGLRLRQSWNDFHNRSGYVGPGKVAVAAICAMSHSRPANKSRLLRPVSPGGYDDWSLPLAGMDRRHARAFRVQCGSGTGADQLSRPPGE